VLSCARAMSQSEAWRYRPLAQQLRTQRGALRRRWSLSEQNDARTAARVGPTRRGGSNGLSNFIDRWAGRGYLGLNALAGNLAFNDYESDVRRSGELAPPRDDWRRGQPAYSGGSYDPGSAPFRAFDVGGPRPPKPLDWDPSPWPTAAGGGGGGDSRAGKLRGAIRYERF